MITAIAINDHHEHANMSRVFARCQSFLLLDHVSGKTVLIKNQAMNSGAGAGKKAVSTLVNAGVTRVIAGEFGAKTIHLLNNANIGMIIVRKAEIKASELLSLMNFSDLKTS